MCNCFGISKRKDKKTEKVKKEKCPTPSSKSMTIQTIQTEALVAASSKVKMITPPSPKKNVDAKSNITTKLRSSPSVMKTDELTEVYKMSNDLTLSELVAAHGYELGEVIGEGSFAKVYKAVRTSDHLVVACKVMLTKSSGRKASAKNELFIIQRTQHPHIIKLYGHFIVDVEKVRHVFIFMQFAEGLSLSRYMRLKEVKENLLPESTCQRFAGQIISAVNHMHSKGIAHCDLKMGNVLLDKDNNCLVADFGLSRVAFRPSKGGTQMSAKFCGTRAYMAPEILLLQEYSNVIYNPFVADCWALGVLMWCVINQKYPFDVERADILEQQLAHRIKFSKKLNWEPSEQLYDFFYRIFEPNVDKRIKMSELMVHPWVADVVRFIEEKASQTVPTRQTNSTNSPSTSVSLK